MAPVILAMDVHCDSCAKKIRKAIMKMPGAESVTASYETGLVVVEGTADAAAVMARLRAKTNKAVRVVSDGVEEEGQAAAAGASGSVYANPPSPAGGAPAYSPAPAPPIVLEMDLHCRSCAEKVERRVMEIPGVDAVTTDVPGRRVEVTGTADASAVATSLEVRTRKAVRVVSDPRSAGRDMPAGYEHEQRKAAAAREAAEQTQEMYGYWATAHAEPWEEAAAAATDYASNHSTVPLSSSSGGMPPSPPASSWSYGGPPPEGGYGDQHWAAPAPPSGGFYMPEGGECYGQYPPPVGALYTHQGGDCFGQQYWRPAYPPPEPEPEGYYPYGGQREDYYPYGGQPDENPGSCSIQ